VGILKKVLYQWRYNKLNTLHMELFNASQTMVEVKEDLEEASMLVFRAANRLKKLSEES